MILNRIKMYYEISEKMINELSVIINSNLGLLNKKNLQNLWISGIMMHLTINFEEYEILTGENICCNVCKYFYTCLSCL